MAAFVRSPEDYYVTKPGARVDRAQDNEYLEQLLMQAYKAEQTLPPMLPNIYANRRFKNMQS